MCAGVPAPGEEGDEAHRLLAAFPDAVDFRGPDPEITGVVYDSRRAVPGSLFVARKHRGYAPIRTTSPPRLSPTAPSPPSSSVSGRALRHPGGRRSRPVARAWAGSAPSTGFPAAGLGMVGVTGTDGKTTTCALTTSILEGAGFATGMISTVASKRAGDLRPNEAHTSTPEAVEVQALLAETLAGGGRRAVMETTSHALDQQRLAGCEFDVAVVTRVTHEHLEYHGTYAGYLEAKAGLLDLLRPDGAHPKRSRGQGRPSSTPTTPATSTLPRAPLCRSCPSACSPRAEVRALNVDAGAWEHHLPGRHPLGRSGGSTCPPAGRIQRLQRPRRHRRGGHPGGAVAGALDALRRHRGDAGRMQRVESWASRSPWWSTSPTPRTP